jgi:hypothetical protein
MKQSRARSRAGKRRNTRRHCEQRIDDLARRSARSAAVAVPRRTRA